MRECAGWVARQVSRSATSDGRLSTDATTGPSGPAIVTIQRSISAPGAVIGHVDDALAARIGDVVALARGSWAFVSPEREPGPSRLRAYHGSLTATELAIPLLAARGRALA